MTPCNPIGLVALSALAAAGLAWGDDSGRLARQIIEPAGWAIPGLEKIVRHKPPTQSITFPLGGKTISCRVYDLSRGSRPSGVTIQLIFVQGDSVVMKHERMIPKLIKEYSLDGVVFCYLVEVAPIISNGIAAKVIDLAYYDDDKNGRFHVLEFPSPILAEGKPVEPIRLPAWAQ